MHPFLLSAFRLMLRFFATDVIVFTKHWWCLLEAMAQCRICHDPNTSLASVHDYILSVAQSPEVFIDRFAPSSGVAPF